ncbi:MAG: hypothetical protein KGL39_12300 [Patescibacteria group bacterium]|nr:hypothetical protein [Patescibacteria group bacterium]
MTELNKAIYRYRPRLGTPAVGYADHQTGHRLKVSVAWDRTQIEAINRRVVKHHSTFAKQVRRLVDMALRVDTLP